jgi:capsular polysaccharide export protein
VSRVKKIIINIYYNRFLPLYEKWAGRSFQRLLRVDTNRSFEIKQIYQKGIKRYVGNNVVPINSHLQYLPTLLHGQKLGFFQRKNADFFYIYGVGVDIFKHWLLWDSARKNIPKLFIEDGFLRSMDIYIHEPGISLLLDDVGMYYDARFPSRLENLLNSDLELSEEQRHRSCDVMKKIRETRVTKYNLAPIYEPTVGRPGVQKVLVIDQAYQDCSIPYGLASDDTFSEMLRAAIHENPDADILVKTHPEAASGGRKGYYNQVKRSGNVYPFTDAINPICLLEYVDKVYCVTTQMGFEALICGKKVVTFGLPFYAGWGLTDQRVTCSRRRKKRSLEEVFYFAYIFYSKYMNPDTGMLCEIEEAIDYLQNERDRRFSERMR